MSSSSVWRRAGGSVAFLSADARVRERTRQRPQITEAAVGNTHTMEFNLARSLFRAHLIRRDDFRDDGRTSS